MKNEPKNVTELDAAKASLTARILQDLLDYSGGMRHAFVNSVFKAMKLANDEDMDKDDIDLLHVLWNLLEDANELRELSEFDPSNFKAA